MIVPSFLPEFPRVARARRAAPASGRHWPAVCATLLAAALTLPAVVQADATNLPQRIVKWTDASGRVHYGDRQPLHQRGGSTREIATRSASADTTQLASAAGTARTPSSAGRQPVTLFMTADCDACELGEAWLVHRGIAHERKDIADPADALAYQTLGFQDLHFPALAVGAERLTGFDMDAWNRTLQAGGYPAAVSPTGDPQQ